MECGTITIEDIAKVTRFFASDVPEMPFMVESKFVLMAKCQRWGIEYKDDFVYKGVRYIESRPLPIKEPI